jgi:hypothetical protein
MSFRFTGFLLGFAGRCFLPLVRPEFAALGVLALGVKLFERVPVFEEFVKVSDGFIRGGNGHVWGRFILDLGVEECVKSSAWKQLRQNISNNHNNHKAAAQQHSKVSVRHFYLQMYSLGEVTSVL